MFNLNKYIFLKEATNQFTRDDPAFVVLLSAFLISNFDFFLIIKGLFRSRIKSFLNSHLFTGQETKHNKYRRRSFPC